MSNGLVEGRIGGEFGLFLGWKLGNCFFLWMKLGFVHIMCSWIPFWQIVGIAGTGETWEASMKCELDVLTHGHEECEFNNVVLIFGKTWN